MAGIERPAARQPDLHHPRSPTSRGSEFSSFAGGLAGCKIAKVGNADVRLVSRSRTNAKKGKFEGRSAVGGFIWRRIIRDSRCITLGRETTRKTRHEKSRNGRYQGRNCSGAGSTSQRRRRRARVAPRVSRSAHRTLKGETVGTFDRPAGGSRVSSRRVPRARDRPGRQLFAVLRAISVILHAFRSSENDARAPTRPRATPKLGESEFPRRFYPDLARIDRFDAPVQAAFRLC